MSNKEKFLKKDDLSNLEFKHLKLMDTISNFLSTY